jgi:hypothetical protein
LSSPEPIQLPGVWVGLEDLSIQMTSQFVAQIAAPNEIILGFGQSAPPMIFGTPEEQRAQLQALRFIQVRPTARLALTAFRVKELIDVLQQTLNNHNTAFGGES